MIADRWTDERCLNPGCGLPMSTHKGPFCPTQAGLRASRQRENFYIDGYDGKWWVHRRDPRQRFGPFDTHPEACREASRMMRETAAS